jgi:inhibitor of cysteine peptidase
MAAVVLTKTDNGKSVEAGVGDEITVQLAENPTTGYRWHVERADGVELIESSYQLDSPAQAGSGGTRIFRFLVKEPSAARIELKHWEMWEGDKSVNERFTVNIKAKG